MMKSKKQEPKINPLKEFFDGILDSSEEKKIMNLLLDDPDPDYSKIIEILIGSKQKDKKYK